MRATLGAAAITLAIVSPAMANEAPPQSPFRYDDDPAPFADPAQRHDVYAALKYIPLGTGSYLSFGGDLRERGEASNTTLLGLRGAESQAYDLHRLSVFADMQLGTNVRVFAQVGNYDEVGRRPSAAPTDRDRMDVSQLFVDFSRRLGIAKVTLRLGRQEMSYDDGALIGLRDGPNVRLAWDGVRVSAVAGGWHVDAFGVRPVAVNPGVFDDGRLPGQVLGGVHLTGPVSRQIMLDAFWYHNRNPAVALFGASGPERTDTVGMRLRAHAGDLDGSAGLIGQRGTAAGGRDVRAFAAHGDIGWGMISAPGSPHVSLRADVLSGGAATASRVSTFNALYPNVAYSTEATIEAPANLVQAGLVIRANPAATVTVQYTVEVLWRYSARDAFYAAPLLPLIRPDASHDRFSGVEQQISAVWHPHRLVTVNAAWVHFSAGDFIKRGGGRDENFGMTSIALRL